MLRDITLGQYYNSNSILHRLDPRVKLFATMLFIITLFVGNDIYEYAFVTVILGAIIIVSKIPLRFIVRGLKPIIMLLIISAGFNIFLTDGNIIVKIWIFTITEQGIKKAAFIGIRLIFLIIGSSVLTLTTTPNNLTDGLEKSLGILNKIRIPIHEIAMMMSIALRFIPILMDETDKIMKAQISRGADFESGNIFRKAKSMIPLLIPLFISAFKRADDLAVSMDSRCYTGGNGRTKMKPLIYKKSDIVAYVCIFIYLALFLFIRFAI